MPEAVPFCGLPDTEKIALAMARRCCVRYTIQNGSVIKTLPFSALYPACRILQFFRLPCASREENRGNAYAFSL